MNEKLRWYWHRLRAMSPAELAGHARRILHRRQDGARRSFEGLTTAAAPDRWPLPLAGAAGAWAVKLAEEAEAIRRGRWTLFHHTTVQVADPPRWMRDVLAGVEVATDEPFTRLNHRALPAGADIKVIWDVSRWTHLVRLAQQSHLSGAAEDAATVRRWLDDWIEKNPPFRGWNWTSALESGIRLIQMAWLDALIDVRDPLARLLPAHVHYTWRYRCFGSSANNHVLGELTGLLVAVARWPELAKWAAPLSTLRSLWQREILAQFAPDGGNREQALHYHLFALEFALHGAAALAAAGAPVEGAVQERIVAAARFLVAVQHDAEPWDYGDSDSATVVPLAVSPQPYPEWLAWLRGQEEGAAIRYWLGAPPVTAARASGWTWFPDSGVLLHRRAEDLMRWDLSPLGYLSMAAHGHCDALHVSLWMNQVAAIIDPGTGAYYGDPPLRESLVGWSAHNGPVPDALVTPVHRGPFLWDQHHPRPRLVRMDEVDASAILDLPVGEVERSLRQTARGWQVTDQFRPRPGVSPRFRVRWQFAPGGQLQDLGSGRFQFHRNGVSLMLTAREGWTGFVIENAAVCSPSFRQTVTAPALVLSSDGGTGAVTEITHT